MVSKRELRSCFVTDFSYTEVKAVHQNISAEIQWPI